METVLEKLEEKLKLLQQNRYSQNYFVPDIWIDPYKSGKVEIVNIKPCKFFLNAINQIKSESKKVVAPTLDKDWSKSAVIYNMFVRYASAFDHDGNGQIETEINELRFKETGTFLKSIALLPYIHSLGVNTIYLLPITSIGIDGRKGELGSPYAIKNPYKLDENLSETMLDMSIEEQFQAFVEACHLLGIKVVVEFVFRTASIDSDLALEHPEWFYWIKEKIKDREPNSKDEKKYGSPVFSEKELLEIKKKVSENDLTKLPAPSQDYIDMFVDVPKQVARVEHRIIGVSGEIEKKNSRIPGAFADWPPDDIQPAWSDVTYLRLYSHHSYNYIAYNTVRMYEHRLTQNQHIVRTLWDNICNIIPYYQQNFNIDGVMIDMGHALPTDLRTILVETARKAKQDFAIWEENFLLTKKSVKDGYNLSLGFLPFDLHDSWKVNNLVRYLAEEGSPISFFGTGETHNTHRTAQRTGGLQFSKFTWALVNFLPACPFILNGFELGADAPINTGLGFNPEENYYYPTEKLALFSVASLNWENENINNYIRTISDLRKKYIISEKNLELKTLEYLPASSIDIIAFQRKFKDNPIIFIANMNPNNEIYFSIKLDEKLSIVKDQLADRVIFIKSGWLVYNLKPFEIIIGEMFADE